MADKFTLEVINCGDGLRPSSNKEKNILFSINSTQGKKNNKKTNKKENVRKRESKNCL